MNNPHDKITEHLLDAFDYLTRGAHRMILDVVYENEEIAPQKIMEILQPEISSSQVGFINKLNSLKKTGWIEFKMPGNKIESVKLTQFGRTMLESIYKNQTILEETFL